MSTQFDPKITTRIIQDSEEPLLIDPKTVGCGFLLFSDKYSNTLQVDHINLCLDGYFTATWNAVKQYNPKTPVYLLAINETDPNPGLALLALNQSGKYPGYSIAINQVEISLDGDRTLMKIYVGFNWKSNVQEIVISGPQMILPAKSVTKTKSAKASKIQTKTTTNIRKWWQFWQ
ncbi:MAG: hypothetical protein WCP85_14965 [Mariniphaga sp.]